MKTPALPSRNRTGLRSSPHADAMEEVTDLTEPSAGDGEALADVRKEYAIEVDPIGSLPPSPAEETAAAMGNEVAAEEAEEDAEDIDEGAEGAGAREEDEDDDADAEAAADPELLELETAEGTPRDLMLDKLGERLAFERTGTRLYEGLLAKVDGPETWEGGPSREELEEFRAAELSHFLLLHRAIEALGGDPTVVTPSADVAAVASCGVAQVIADPRTTLSQSLEAMLTAELADRDGWSTLIRLAESALPERVAEFELAIEEEREHLESVRGWLEARYGLPPSAAPTEETSSDVTAGNMPSMRAPENDGEAEAEPGEGAGGGAVRSGGRAAARRSTASRARKEAPSKRKGSRSSKKGGSRPTT